MLRIKKSPTADSRTCDVTKVSKEQLLASSRQHIGDVALAIDFFVEKLEDAAATHDDDKIHDIDWFYRCFQTKFSDDSWWTHHRKIWRHHLNFADGVPEDVNLIDVLEHVADCVMAGMARNGTIYDVVLPDDLLQKALRNTVDLLVNEVEVVEDGGS